MAEDSTDFDLYEELEVSPRASPEVIQAAYRRLAREFHPDTGRDPNPERMVRLNRAYATLSEPAARRRYDGLRGTRARPGERDRAAQGARAPRSDASRERQQSPFRSASEPPWRGSNISEPMWALAVAAAIVLAVVAVVVVVAIVADAV